MEGVELEEKIIEAIERTVTPENLDETKTYFANITVNDMIDEAFEDWGK